MTKIKQNDDGVGVKYQLVTGEHISSFNLLLVEQLSPPGYSFIST